MALAWDSETEEHEGRRLRRVLRAVGSVEAEVDGGATAPAVMVEALDWADEYEGPVRGRLRRALMSVD